MMEYVGDPALLTSVPIIEEVLNAHAPTLGRDFVGYRNHVYRVLNFCLASIGGKRLALEKIATAAVFHDLGIWTSHTFDYIAPSVALAREHLAGRGQVDWIPEVEAMIVEHHKITRSSRDAQSLVEGFRRADWIDVSRGLRRFGLPRSFIATVLITWPDSGFHRRLAQLTLERLSKHPLSALPMVKW